MSNFETNTTLTRNTSILANQIGNETVMMSIEEGRYYGMNKTGSHIWSLLEQPLSFGELCERLATDYNVSPSQCAIDIKPFIEEMSNEKIIFIK